MPLFNTNTSKRRRPPGGGGLTIILEKMLLVSCEDIITLNAQLTGTPLGPQTYLWTQLSGSAVIWLEAQNQTMVMFQQPVVKDDKVFRFWLDKGTPWEQHADILVTLVSLDPIPVVRASPLFASVGTDAQLISPPFAIEPAPTAPGLNALTNNSERMLVFMPLANPQYAAQLSVMHLHEGLPPTLEQTLPISAKYVRNLQENEVYRIDTVTNNHGFITVIKGKPMTCPPPPNTDVTTMEDLRIHFGTSQGLSYTQATVHFTVIGTSVTDHFNASPYSGVFTASQQTITRSLERQNLTDDQKTNLHFAERGLTQTKVVTQSTYSSIGSGS